MQWCLLTPPDTRRSPWSAVIDGPETEFRAESDPIAFLLRPTRITRGMKPDSAEVLTAEERRSILWIPGQECSGMNLAVHRLLYYGRARERARDRA